jgi:hypothetical protein
MHMLSIRPSGLCFDLVNEKRETLATKLRWEPLWADAIKLIEADGGTVKRYERWNGRDHVVEAESRAHGANR